MKGPAARAYVLVKQVYSFGDGSPKIAPAEPLVLSGPGDGPPPLGADFWPRKPRTDVVVLGEARPPRGVIAREMMVCIRVGAAEKKIAVFGPRRISRAGAGVRVSAPDPIERVPLDASHAYGGLDPRWLAGPGEVLQGEEVEIAVDHPGAYPRNLWGRGYLVGEPPAGDIEMPSLEDPADLLSEERLIVREPAAWYEQPLPWHAGWTSGWCFPRRLGFLGADTLFPGPDDERMVEVRRGYLAAGYRSRPPRLLDPEYAQEASHGLVVAGLRGGEAVSLQGVDPAAPEIGFELPAAPELTLACEGARETAPGKLHSLVIRPAERKLAMVLGAELALPRTFLPGVHKRIPVSATVDGGAPIWFETPPTWKSAAR
jgi:hypothetical protein